MGKEFYSESLAIPYEDEEEKNMFKDCRLCGAKPDAVDNTGWLHLEVDTTIGPLTTKSVCPNCVRRITANSESDEPDPPANSPSFAKELENLINCHSIENGSNTPDFILAEYLMGCLRAYENACKQKEAWHR
jgi:hypothetical protein